MVRGLIIGVLLLAVLGAFALGSDGFSFSNMDLNPLDGGFNANPWGENPPDQRATNVVGANSDGGTSSSSGVPQAPILEEIDVVISGEIDWNESLQIRDFMMLEGLAPGVMVQYVETAKHEVYQWAFQVPDETDVVIGGFEVTLNGETHTDGFYTVVREGHVQVTIVDGFLLIVDEDNAEVEFCHRVAQVKAQTIDGRDPWVASHVDMPDEWTCDDTYSVPVDSGPGGTIPSGSGALPSTATPLPGASG